MVERAFFYYAKTEIDLDVEDAKAFVLFFFEFFFSDLWKWKMF